MKRISLVIGIVIGIFSFLRLLLTEQNISFIGSIVTSLFAGLVTFALLQLLLLPMKKSKRTIISDMINKGEDVKSFVPMNYVGKCFILSIGGVGFLYSDKFVFVPHAMNFSRKEIFLFFNEIKSVSQYEEWGVNLGLKIILNSGKTEKFVINKSSQFYKDLLSLVPS